MCKKRNNSLYGRKGIVQYHQLPRGKTLLAAEENLEVWGEVQIPLARKFWVEHEQLLELVQEVERMRNGMRVSAESRLQHSPPPEFAKRKGRNLCPHCGKANTNLKIMWKQRHGVLKQRVLRGNCVQILRRKGSKSTASSPYQFFIAPNPTKGRFSVHVELRESMDFTLSLYSSTAIVVARKQFRHTQAQSFEFELRDDAEGLYSVELRVGDERSLLKLIKLKN